MYEAAVAAIERKGSIVEMTEDDLLNAIEHQAREGARLHNGPLRRYQGIHLKAAKARQDY